MLKLYAMHEGSNQTKFQLDKIAQNYACYGSKMQGILLRCVNNKKFLGRMTLFQLRINMR